MDTIIVIMEKDKKTGFLEKEVASLSLSKNEEFIVNIYAEADKLCIKLSDEKELDDWEYNAAYDYFDPEALGETVSEVKEVEDTYCPTWEVVTDFDENNLEGLGEKVEKILEAFKTEIYDVYETIKDKKGEYIDE